MSSYPAVVIDNGSGFTKVGCAGSIEPITVFPTLVSRVADADKQAYDHYSAIDSNFNDYAHSHISPMKHGIVEDWNAMESLWHHCFFEELRCNPHDHFVLLTETPMNSPENREEAAEIMFETFNVPGLHISVQAVLSLVSSSYFNKMTTHSDLTGCVVDSGYGSTQIVPVVNGHVMSSYIEQMELGGRDVTAYVQQLLRERKEPIPSEMSLDVARTVKEQHSYTCPDLEKECERFDCNPQKFFRMFDGIHKKTGLPFSFNMQYERFLAPETVMNPKVR